MWLNLPDPWVLLINIIGIPMIHLASSWAFTKMPISLFKADQPAFRKLPGETSTIYKRSFFIGRWKHYLPDAAPWFGGFGKRKLQSQDLDFLRRFEAETCRSEVAHWAQLLAVLSFTLWTPWPWALIIWIYALASNAPCILLQRHNRLRLTRLIRRHTTSG
ncbi:hypothetical protein ACFQY0_06825 [Haloferula chungangensis]|uniref:Glycosyl-4,4'-diaponeurosporenoate acyltransferase n=1 Tax=Haloferula chungangensis TaxID=1048331 RepID=A0ABW2L3F6_9BACT